MVATWLYTFAKMLNYTLKIYAFLYKFNFRKAIIFFFTFSRNHTNDFFFLFKNLILLPRLPLNFLKIYNDLYFSLLFCIFVLLIVSVLIICFLFCYLLFSDVDVFVSQLDFTYWKTLEIPMIFMYLCRSLFRFFHFLDYIFRGCPIRCIQIYRVFMFFCWIDPFIIMKCYFLISINTNFLKVYFLWLVYHFFSGFAKCMQNICLYVVLFLSLFFNHSLYYKVYLLWSACTWIFFKSNLKLFVL